MYNENTKFIIDSSEPFKGYTISSISINTYVDFSGQLHNQHGQVTGVKNENLTFDQYSSLETNKGKTLKIITNDELTELMDQYENDLTTPVKQISEDDYYYFLEVLPPRNWHNIGGASVFYMSEFQYGNITAWYISCDGYFYTFDGKATMTDQEVREKMINLTQHKNIKSEYARQ